jgi:hypothetical protein
VAEVLLPRAIVAILMQSGSFSSHKSVQSLLNGRDGGKISDRAAFTRSSIRECIYAYLEVCSGAIAMRLVGKHTRVRLFANKANKSKDDKPKELGRLDDQRTLAKCIGSIDHIH